MYCSVPEKIEPGPIFPEKVIIPGRVCVWDSVIDYFLLYFQSTDYPPLHAVMFVFITFRK